MDKPDPHLVQMTEVFVRRHKRSFSCMGCRCNPEIVLRHWDSRSGRRRHETGRIHRPPVGPGIDPGVCVQDGMSIDIECRKCIQDLLKSGPLLFTPAVFLRKCKNLTLTDHGGNSGRFSIVQIESLESLASPGRFPGEPEQYAGIQEKISHRRQWVQSS